MNELRRSRRLGAGILFVTMLLAACSAAAAPSASTPPVDSSPDTPVTAPPSDGSGGGTNPGSIGGAGKLVVPKPGQLDVRDIRADELQARVDGSTIIVTASWTSGVEPCNVLDSIVVTSGANSYAITLREGHGREEVACIAIAEIHKTEFEIPNVKPGTYQITDATGGAAPIEVTVG
jgi:ABC-type transport system substrate-binding protein